MRQLQKRKRSSEELMSVDQIQLRICEDRQMSVFYFSDVVVGETTCDGKKKAWEILAEECAGSCHGSSTDEAEKGRQSMGG